MAGEVDGKPKREHDFIFEITLSLENMVKLFNFN